MKIVFFGSSEFSIPALQACLDSKNPVVLVITTPDRKKGRGLKLLPTCVRTFAEERGLPVEAAETLKDEALIEKVRALAPDVFVVSSYGKLIPDAWLRLPQRGSMNVHPSLLPKYRGASPINAAILKGDKETGLTIMDVAKELDAGDIFYQKRIKLPETLNAEALAKELAAMSHGAVLEVLRQFQGGKVPRHPQNAKDATYAHKIKKEDGAVDWTRTAADLANLARGLFPWPAACFQFGGEPVKIMKARVGTVSNAEGKPGQLLEINKRGYIRTQTGKGSLIIERVRPAGKKEMSGADFVHGNRLKVGHVFK